MSDKPYSVEQPPLQWMKDFVAGVPQRTIHIEYVNWAMEQTGNHMFVDLNTAPCREHWNILKEACEQFINKVGVVEGCE